MTPVALRRVPGALILGLLASLAAHAALYGGSHAMGGSYHGLLVQVALAGLLALSAFFGALAWASGSRTSDGTVLAARMRHKLPAAASVLLAAGAWYVVGESIEPGHAAAPVAASLLALVAASFAVAWLARAVTSAIARVVLAITNPPFLSRTPSWQRRPRGRIASRRTVLTHRRFARPPPIATFNGA